MPNINKVVFGNTTLIDLTDSTLSSADQLASGVTAYDRSGTLLTGTGSSGGGGIIIEDTLDSHGGTVRTITATPVNLQTKSATPSESAQTIEPDIAQGYTGLSSVSVGAIPSDYVGSAIDERDSTDLTASGATVTVPAGYYENAASKTVASGSASTPATTITANPSISVSSSGLITATASASQSITPSVSAGYVSSGTAGTVSVSGSNTSQLTTQAAQTIYPSASDQSIASGRYLTGAQTIKGVAIVNLSAENIKSGVTVTVGDSADADRIVSVTGNYSGGSSKAIYMYQGLATRTANSYGSTSATVTVTKAGTYNISYVAIRGSSSGTMGTNLHIGDNAGTNNQTFTNGTYGQYVSLTDQQIAANTAVTIYATSGSTTRSLYVGQLIVQEV